MNNAMFNPARTTILDGWTALMEGKMDKMTTVLEWNRYDGTAKTLPEEGRHVIVAKCLKKGSYGVPRRAKLEMRSYGPFWEMIGCSVRCGALWAYWPEAPKVQP